MARFVIGNARPSSSPASDVSANRIGSSSPDVSSVASVVSVELDSTTSASLLLLLLLLLLQLLQRSGDRDSSPVSASFVETVRR